MDDSVEVRIRLEGQGYILTTKLDRGSLSRPETESVYPHEIGKAVYDASAPREMEVIKDRYGLMEDANSLYKVDVFAAGNQGLVMAEVGLPDDVDSVVTIPEWCGREVTGVLSFYNAELARRPLKDWPEAERASYGL